MKIAKGKKIKRAIYKSGVKNKVPGKLAQKNLTFKIFKSFKSQRKFS